MTNTGFIDLHVHTTASDGTLTPAETVRLAADSGLKAVAITDHDTVDGIAEAVAAGGEAGIEVVPGVEISVDFGGEMHILGYYIDPQNRHLQQALRRLRGYRDMRNPRIIEKLQGMGFDISLAEVSAMAPREVIGRPHFAAVMKQKGYVRDNEQAFELYLGAGKPAYVKKERLTPREGIALIAAAGGIPVLAHPKYLSANRGPNLEGMVEELMKYGLKGIEVFYTSHTPEDTERLYRLARKKGILATGGTDFHGANKPKTKIGIGEGGLAVKYELLEQIKQSRVL